MEEDRVSRLVVCGNSPLLVGDDPALLLRSDADFHKSMPDIRLLDKHSVVLRGKDRRLVQEILKVSPGESRSPSR